MNYEAKAAALKLETRAFINGEYVAARSGNTTVSRNPANGREIARITACEQEDVDLAVSAAKKAFDSGVWANKPPRERKKILLKFADLIEQHREELALLETLDSGKTISDTMNVDVPDTIETLRWHAEAIDKVCDQMTAAPYDVVSMLVREPIGVVGAVLPWNFPLFTAAWKFAPALATGNSIVLKPANQTALSLIRLAGLSKEAGIPDGVFNVVPGRGAVVGQALGLHPDVDMISFTGSGEVGRNFLQYSAASNLKRIVLECGGKSPAIVMGDVEDFTSIVEHICNGILFCQGENCSAGSRLIVHESVKEPLLAELKKAFSEWTVGHPFDENSRIGALIEESHLNKVLGLIEQGKAEGGTIAFGGNRLFTETGGYYVEPTIIDNVRNDMTVAREEIFGPVLSVISFKTEEEAISLANDTNFGLASSLHTNDLNVAHRVAKAIRAGTVAVNCYTEGDYGVPFGGYKESGFGGKDKGLAAHEQYTQLKAIWIQLK